MVEPIHSIPFSFHSNLSVPGVPHRSTPSFLSKSLKPLDSASTNLARVEFIELLRYKNILVYLIKLRISFQSYFRTQYNTHYRSLRKLNARIVAFFLCLNSIAAQNPNQIAVRLDHSAYTTCLPIPAALVPAVTPSTTLKHQHSEPTKPFQILESHVARGHPPSLRTSRLGSNSPSRTDKTPRFPAIGLDVTFIVSAEPPSVRCESPSPEITPTPAIGACPNLSRCVSTASDLSHGSGSEFATRDSLGSDAFSRQSSASYGRRSDVSFASSRQSTHSDGSRPSRRRGYMRPQGTAFAASAQSRESVLSLGSIAHLQYYFARTGLLDGKGAQLQRKNKQNRATLDLSALDTSTSSSSSSSLLLSLSSSSLSPRVAGSDVDSSYASMGSSPELAASGFGSGPLVESPIEEPYYSDEFDEPDPDMPPPTTSTYIHREKPVPPPPTVEELKSDLTGSLEKAAEALKDARDRKDGPRDVGEGTSQPAPATESPRSHHARQKSKAMGWYELQGMHILDVTTLAIRAAKMYYTAHEQPERLDSIKSERQIRAELFSVMETLKQMATRRWAGGIRDDELANLETWIRSLFDMLKQEDEMEEAERAERAGWMWLKGDWTGRETERELAFLASLAVDLGLPPLPEYTPAAGLAAGDLPTPFLKSMQNGLRLVKLHNAAVKKSKRRFGSITPFHEDTEKPYRCADNLRYWVKAAELRWEVLLKVDALGVVCNTGPQVWTDFEAAIWKWCRKAREEIAAELDV
ncbi:hypothetical protein SODALDRAFT_379751 [Sodiomyces alkalinus F11]|uniref:Uncharacterized protein n=1 Tax=Sodiomyces alkalinus (strain CBS 110278 / VKM F-3762 / F11) TaxID=1314773 RepID=A0A3N2PRZ4_SODAK|nr:hypothetical protein SODALDRAFT_379751 [Sodiomyces alkalinus F11]ROT37277.1 hypothetical protein SODALDRAFT_379751 [Sodiomyces alkalinus F11]